MPFPLPSNDEFSALQCSLGEQCELSGELREVRESGEMREVYLGVVPELQALLILYNRERETAPVSAAKKIPKV